MPSGTAPVGIFSPNVNVLTQDALGLDLASYMEFSGENMGSFELIENSMIVGTNGYELGLLEYRGVVPGASTEQPLHFLATVDIRDGVAIVATLSSIDADFNQHREAAEQFLRSLQAT